MPRQKTKINETVKDFLFNQIRSNPDYINWEKAYSIPDYITDNLNTNKTLREYQKSALKHFIWMYEYDRDNAIHLLFNMATGTGKTLVMAAIILFLYEKGYRNFLFMVHQLQIKDQAQKNFTDYKFDKYLFNKRGIKINGQNIDIKTINTFQDSNRNAINFIFVSTSLLYNRIKEDRENQITAEDFSQNKIIVIADEAHRLNVDTRSKKKKDIEEILNWETAIMSAVNSCEENMLLEFTATVDLANLEIHDKYKNKLVYRYSFLEFNQDGYSKDVKFLYNQEVHTEDQKRLLIINAVALSEYRKLLFERTMHVTINPIILIKSNRIAQSEEDQKFFENVISSLRPNDLNRLHELTRANNNLEHEILTDMFRWIASEESGLISKGDWSGLNEFTANIRNSFAKNNTIIYNSQKKENSSLLTKLDEPRNNIRAIFSVNALNEGWDVLALYDIVHLDISETKKVSLQDIQLIGRGARYCPYELPRTYKRDEDNEKLRLLPGRNLVFDKFKRKFDNDPFDKGRVLETFVYHFVKTGTFLENLQRDLLGEGIMNEGIETRTINMKQKFLDSNTYKNGFVLINKTEKQTKTLGDAIDTKFNRIIKAGLYNLRARGLSEYEQNQIIASQRLQVINITNEYFSAPIIRKALISAENNFFRINNLREHIVDLNTINEFIEEYLPLYEINYTYTEGKNIIQLSPKEKLQLLVGIILPEVRKSIDINIPRITGSNKFRPLPISALFSKSKDIYLISFPAEDPLTGEKKYISNDERSRPQSNHDKHELRYEISSADWYAYDENYGTSEEKKFVKYIASQIDDLYKKYKNAEIYLIRNEIDYWIFSPQDGRRFSPDYILIINDFITGEIYYQCLIEPKGGHILEQEIWKEEALISLDENSEIVFDSEESDTQNYKIYLEEISKHGYKEIKNLGLRFYNSEPRGEEDFAFDFQDKLYDLSN